MSLPVSVYKIGTNKGRPRIWIDGARLAAAGFTGGTTYRCEAKPGEIRLSIDPDATGRLRKVTGRPDGKPIIDMLGADVALAFPDVTHVIVNFRQGRIVIRANARKE